MRQGPSVETLREQPRVSPNPAETRGDPLAPKPTDSELLSLLKAKIRRLPTLEKDMPDAARDAVLKKYAALRDQLSIGMAALDPNEIQEINAGFESRIEKQKGKSRFHQFSEPVQAMGGLLQQGKHFLAAKANEGTALSAAHDGVRAGLSGAALWAAVSRFVPGPWGLVAGVGAGVGGTYVASKLGRFLSRFGMKPETGQKVAQWITAAGATAVAVGGTLATGGLGTLGTIGLLGGIGGLSMLANRSVFKGQQEEQKEKLRAEFLEVLRKEEQQAEQEARGAVLADPNIKRGVEAARSADAPSQLAA